MSKILLAAMSLDIGGAETHVVELTRELCRRGHNVTVASAGGVYVADIVKAGAIHVYAPLKRRSLRDMTTALGTLSFLIKSEKYDIVHAHARIPAFLCGLLQKRYRFRFVTTAHWVFKASGAEKLLTNWGERTIAVSEDIKQYLLGNYKMRAESITVSVNGINTERFSPGVSGKRVRTELKIPASAPVIVCVARLDNTESAPTVTVKGLIDAASDLRTVLPDLRIVIVGGGNAEDEFRALASEVNDDAGFEMITLTGPRTDVNELLAMCDLFVGVSRAALEAMSTAKPVILAGSEGYAGLYTPDKLALSLETNFCFRGSESTDAAKLTRDIVDFFRGFGSADYEIRAAKLGADGRDAVAHHYSVTRMTDDCESAYNSLLGGGNRPASSEPHTCQSCANYAKGCRRAVGADCTRWKSAATHGAKQRVVMSGYFGFGNAGDEAIMQAVYRSISDARPGTEITVLSKNPRATTARYGYRAVGRFNPFGVAAAILRCDALIFGGGSLLQDHTSTRSLMYYLTIIRAARFFRRDVMIYANGIGPVTRPKNRSRVARAVESATLVTLRDERSRDELIAMGVTRRDMHVTSDPVFTFELPENAERLEILRRAGLQTARPFAAISVRTSAHPEFITELARLCDAISSELERDIVFLPMQSPSDAEASHAVMQKMTTQARLPAQDLSPREMLAVLTEADFAVSMRLHTLIFAARAGTPSAGIVVDPKVTAYLEMLAMPAIGTPDDFHASAALQAVRELSAHRDEHRRKLNALSDSLAERSGRDAELLGELLK